MKKFILVLLLAAPMLLVAQTNRDIETKAKANVEYDASVDGAMDIDYSSLVNKHTIGLFLGMSNSATDVHCFSKYGEGLLDKSGLGYGINYTYNFNPNWGVRLGYMGTTLTGNDKDVNRGEGSHHSRGFNYTSGLHELSALLQWDLLGKKRYKGGAFRKTFSPYILAGLGVSITNPEVDWNEGAIFPNKTVEDIKRDKAEVNGTSLQIPLGIGVKYDLTRKMFLGLEARSIYSLSDYLDGVHYSGNEDMNDYYYFLGGTLGFNLGISDRDKDGIADAIDNCPDVAGVAALAGCPDSDGDGITDASDDCPMVAGLAALSGCPDGDGDGIADKFDDCPTVAGESKFKGCPDSDGDGIRDMDDKCPNEPGSPAYAGCTPPDADGDGIEDSKDMCPDTPGTLKGCPDSDGDGFADKDDRCPNVKGMLAGCPDSDGDGISDAADKCPKVKGTMANNGCPARRKVVRNTAPIPNWAKDLYFNTASSGLNKKARLDVDEILRISRQYPEAKFMVSGYTDSRGNETMNQKLSEKRAKAVYDILIKRGVSASRLRYAGYGEQNPKVPNNSKGYKLNRRVEVRFTR